jgi:hypothetical protein
MTLPDAAERPTLAVEEVARLLGTGRTATYAACREYLRTGGASGVPAIRIGSRILCPTAAIRRFVMADIDEAPT